MSDTSEAPQNQAQAKSAEPHPLDALTGGAFSAATSGERAARIREWLTSDPAQESLQEVFKALSEKDKGAARAVRERLDEIRRAHTQQAIGAEWEAKAQALLAQPRLNIADAMAWQRDAAKAGAPLSREPLSALKQQLAERIKTVEDLQHRVQVQREAAVLLAQRIEVLSTKPWQDAQAVMVQLGEDVGRWNAQADELLADACWPSVDARFATQLELARTQLQSVWEAFQSALAQTLTAAADVQAPLPPVPVWADALRAARGLPSEAAAQEEVKRPARPKIDPQQREQVMRQVEQALAVLEQETAQGHGKASSGAAAALRGVLKTQGRFIDAGLEHRVHQALVAAGELEGWQRWSADQIREELVAKAEALLARPEGQALGGRKMQESLRQLREQWKQTDKGGAANHGLWKKFDDACNAAHKVVEAWLEKVREEAAEHRAQRQALIDEVHAWAQAQTDTTDWKAVSRTLHQFGERWRNAGHLGEKAFAELQPLWKQALASASAPLEAAQKRSLALRQALIEEAVVLGAAPVLRIDAIKALQQRWQSEAQSVPLDRRQEQKLWDAFRQPIDEAFGRKSAERERSAATLSMHDKAVLDAAKALEVANASGDAQRIQAAMQTLDAALQGQGAASTETMAPAESTADAPAPSAEAPAPARPVVAVRGDDRPGARKEAAPAAGRTAARPPTRKGERGGFDARGPRTFEREPRGPRLGDAAFRAQRDARDQAQIALRKLAAQAHGEALTQLLNAWQQRDAQQLPAAQELGRQVNGATRGAWAQALAAAPAGDPGQALLRLEMAADVPTPAEHLAARRALQLQMLTRRNDPAPQETWGQDTARVLASESAPDTARRLQSALKALLRK